MKNGQQVVSIILRAVAVVMAVVAIVLGITEILSAETNIAFLGIGLLALSLASFSGPKK